MFFGGGTATPGIVSKEHYQRGWNDGYAAGDAERITLATANTDLRSQLLDARQQLAAALTETLI